MSVVPLPHTGDVGFEARAATPSELFECARGALVDLLLEAPPRRATDRRELRLGPAPLEPLLVRWLDELLYLVQTAGLVPLEARPHLEQGDGGWTLTVRLPVAPLDPHRHGFRGEIKGATYHGLEVDPSPGACRARVILDV